jgi:hypothetical protein
MSKKRILLAVLCLMGALVVLAMMLPAFATYNTKRRATRIQTVNSIPNFSFTLTNNTATNRLPVSKP